MSVNNFRTPDPLYKTTAPGKARNGLGAESRHIGDSHNRKNPVERVVLAVD